MTTIHIDEYVNGFGLKVFDGTLIINEFFEEKVKLYERLVNFFANQVKTELELRGQYAAHL